MLQSQSITAATQLSPKCHAVAALWTGSWMKWERWSSAKTWRVWERHKKRKKGQKDQRGGTVSGTHWEEIDQRKEMREEKSRGDRGHFWKEWCEVTVSPIILYATISIHKPLQSLCWQKVKTALHLHTPSLSSQMNSLWQDFPSKVITNHDNYLKA